MSVDDSPAAGANMLGDARLVRRQWRIVLVLVLVGGAAALAFQVAVRPLYTAAAVVSVDLFEEGTKVPVREGLQRSEAIAREAVSLRSLELAERVVEAHWREFASELSLSFPSTTAQRLLLELGQRLGRPARNDGTLVAGVYSFVSRVTIESEPSSSWITIRFTAYDPGIAARAANGLAEAFVEQTRVKSQTGAVKDLAETRAEVEARGTALTDTYRGLQQGGVVNETLARKETSQRLASSLREELVRAKTSVIEKRARHRAMMSADDEAISAQPGLRQDPAFLSAEARRIAATSRIKELSKTLGDQHPEIQQLRADLADASAIMAARIAAARQASRQEYEEAVALEASLERESAAAQRDFSAKEVEAIDAGVSRLQAAAEERQLLDVLQSARRDIVAHVRTVQPADPVRVSVTPDLSRNLLGGSLIGLALGAVLALLREGLDRRVLDAEELRQLGVRVLGLVPRVSAPKALVRGDLANPESLLAEAYRIVRVAIARRDPNDPCQVIVMTSPNPTDGKTTSSVSLANVLAKNGDRVLLIDTDLRRPALNEYFGGKDGPGFASAVTRGSLEGLTLTVCPNLDFLPAGVPLANPAEVLSSEACARVLRQARGLYQYVICDAPPCLPVADALILSPLADGLILVVSSGQTPERALRDSLARVGEQGASMLGVVLNRVDTRGLGYRHYGTYSYKRRMPPVRRVRP